MRILILSDIHGNLQALNAVVEHAAGTYDNVVCLGDVVGYGADPNAVSEWVRQNVALTIRGNHDRACVGDPVIEDFNDNAQFSCLWTLERLTESNRTWLKELPAGPQPFEGFYMCHGSPRDEDEYVTDRMTAISLFPFMPGNLCFFGHTHWQGGFRIAPGRMWVVEPPKHQEQERIHFLDRDKAFLINPGSVGQPRDLDPRAGYAILDTDAWSVALRRTTYDIRKAQLTILSAGLPHFLAGRLSEGL